MCDVSCVMCTVCRVWGAVYVTQALVTLLLLLRVVWYCTGWYRSIRCHMVPVGDPLGMDDGWDEGALTNY